MKKKVVIGIVLAVCLVAALASPALAAAPTLTSVTPGNGTPSSTTNVTVSVTLVGTLFELGASVDVSGSGVAVSDILVNSSTNITATFTLAAGAAAGDRNVTVTTSGGTSNSKTFTVNAYITVVAPSAIVLGYMTAGATKTATTTAGTVASNYGTWSVSAIDAKGTQTGYMNTQANGSGTSLAARFQISKTASNYADANAALTYTDKPTTLPFFISQVVAANAAPGSYQITITFTGSY